MAVANTTKTVVGIFYSLKNAEMAVSQLESAGIPRVDISLVANKNATGYDQSTSAAAGTDKTSNVVADAGIGAAIGGVGGLLLSLAGALTLPVIGPILAAGPIAAALTGAGVGAAAGGLIGALTEAGIPEEDAKYYAEGIRRGDVLVTVNSDSAYADRARKIMDDNGAVDVNERLSNWKQRGWKGFDTNAKPYSPEELRKERSYYPEAAGQHVRDMGREMKNDAEQAGRSVRRTASRVYDRIV